MGILRKLINVILLQIITWKSMYFTSSNSVPTFYNLLTGEYPAHAMQCPKVTRNFPLERGSPLVDRVD